MGVGNKLRNINWCKGWKLSENKALEIQFATVKDFSDWFSFKLYTKSKCDHAGIRFNFEFMTIIFFEILFYDIRHWDYDNNTYQKYD